VSPGDVVEPQACCLRYNEAVELEAGEAKVLDAAVTFGDCIKEVTLAAYDSEAAKMRAALGLPEEASRSENDSALASYRA
jgi:hypothetical protein